jgi:hypothetical protein
MRVKARVGAGLSSALFISAKLDGMTSARILVTDILAYWRTGRGAKSA